MSNFNAIEVKDKCVQWIRDFFDKNGNGCNAVVGISGGKDSSVVAALCVEALGKDRVIGVLMPNHIQDDIQFSHILCEHLGIKNYMYLVYNDLDSNIESEKMKSIDSNTIIVTCLNNAVNDASMEGTSILTITALYFDNPFDFSSIFL